MMVREGFVVCLRVLNNYTPPRKGFNEVSTRIVDLHFWDVEDPLNFGSVTKAATKDAAIIGEEMKIKKTKGDLHQFGTRVARAIWPEKRNVQRLGVLIFSVCALLGVSRARDVQKMFLGSTASAPETQTKLSATVSPALVTTNSTAVQTTEAELAQSGAPNIIDLIAGSETIISGAVKEVTDGFENGIPYTQVTIEVNETLRGQVGEEYTFRQFGLTKPRSMGNGKVYIGTTPEGWSKYEVNEDAMFFLYKPASMTGLQTTTGLGQGKVMFKGGNAISQAGNEGLFENVDVNAGLLNDKDKRLLATKRGAVNAEGFKSFVRRAVNGKWIEGGKMRHAKN